MGIKPLALAVTTLVLSTSVNSALILTIDNYTTDELSFSISGIFDADSAGNQPGWLAIKNNWSNNNGVHTEMFNTIPTITLNTITFGGITSPAVVQNEMIGQGNQWNDAIFWENPNGKSTPFITGTSVSGSMSLTGAGVFNLLNGDTLELISGFNTTTIDWDRLESSAVISIVPIPGAVWLFGSGLIGLVGVARRKKYNH